MASAHGAERSGFRDWIRLHETISSGVVTGVAGGVVMMVIAVLGAASQGLTPLHPAMVLGETFVGPEAFEGAAGKVAFGLLVHLVTSVGLATLVAAILPADFPTASAIGVGVGLVLLSFMFVLMPLLVPWAHPGFRAGMQGMGGTWIAGLAVFGATLGAGPALRRWAARGASRQAREDVALGGRTGAVAAAGRKA